MSACPRCGTVAKPTDKFCNVCGTPLARRPRRHAPPASGARRNTPPRRGPVQRRVGVPPQTQAPAPQSGGGAPGDCPLPDGARDRARARATAPRATRSRSTRCSSPTSRRTAADRPRATRPRDRLHMERRKRAPVDYAPPQPQAGYGAPPQQYAPPAARRLTRLAAGRLRGPPRRQPYGADSRAPGRLRRPRRSRPRAAPPPQAGYGAPAAPLPNDDVARRAAAAILRGFLVAYDDATPAGDFWPLDGRAPHRRPSRRRRRDRHLAAGAHHLVAARGDGGRRRQRRDHGRGHRIDQRHVRERRAHRLQRTPRAPRRRPPALRRLHDHREGHRPRLSDDFPRSTCSTRSERDDPTTYPRSPARALFPLAWLALSPDAGAAPEAHILRIDPRAGLNDGKPTLTTVIEVVQFKRLCDVLQPCAARAPRRRRSAAGASSSRSPARSGTRSLSPRQNAHLLVQGVRRGPADEVRRQGAVGQGAEPAQRRHRVARLGRRVERDGRRASATRAPSRTSSSRRCSRTT